MSCFDFFIVLRELGHGPRKNHVFIPASWPQPADEAFSSITRAAPWTWKTERKLHTKEKQCHLFWSVADCEAWVNWDDRVSDWMVDTK
jgi:hypothetical protein